MFAASSKQKTTSSSAPQTLNTEIIYARVIGIMASSRDTVSIDTLFCYELSPYPSAMFDENGELRSTNKSVLKNKIKVECGQRNKEPPVVVILDGCAILWTVPWPASPAKVSAFVNNAVATITKYVQTTQILHVVFDRYYNDSIKSCCRTKRAQGFCREYRLTSESPLPKQSIVLKVAANKVQIIKLIVDQLCLIQIADGKQVIITGPDPHPIEVSTGVQRSPVTHEEANVLIVYHMIQEAVAGHSPIKVVCDDTDVLLILAHHLHANTNNMSHTVKLFMESCSKNRAIIDVNEVVKKHSKIMPNLLGAHAITGCDTVSCFAGIGKTTVFKKLEAFPDSLKLGDTSTSLEDITASCLDFVATLYGQKAGDQMNAMRATIFRRKIGGKRHVPPKLSSLPPTMAAFRPHCQRAHYQTALWKAADKPSPPNKNRPCFNQCTLLEVS